MSNHPKSEFCFLMKPVNADDDIAVLKNIECFFDNLKIVKPKLIIDFIVALKSNIEKTRGLWVL